MTEALFLFFRYDFGDIVRRVSDDLAQFFERQHIDVLVVPEAVQNPVSDVLLHRMITGSVSVEEAGKYKKNNNPIME